MHDRRRFLSQGLKLGAAWLVGCKEQPYRGLRAQREASVGDGRDGIGDSGTHLRPEPALDGGSYQGTLNFVGEDDPSFGTPFNEGLDGRQYTDLSALDEGALLTPSAEFYIRTRTPDRLDREAPWLIRIDGLVTEVVTVEFAPLLEAARPMGTYLLECSGNARSAGFGLISQAEFSGVPLLEVLERAPPTVASARLQVAGFDEHSMPSAGGHSTPGASWIFSQEQLQDTAAFLATAINGEPLPVDHGAPVRLFVPGWYGCCSIKWVNTLSWLDDEAKASSQMQEFAKRTHQVGVPDLARDFAAAEMDTAAMPIRVERWQVEGRELVRIIGIVWGGKTPITELQIRIGDDPWELFRCEPSSGGPTWTLWEFVWIPPRPGVYSVVLRVPTAGIRTRRLDAGYYLREFAV